MKREELLTQLACKLPEGALRLGTRCRGLSEAEGKLFCDLESGWEGPFDLVVAADGLRSSVRRCAAASSEVASQVLLLGDARRGFQRERDLGVGRIYQGGNAALAEGLALARALRGGAPEAFAFEANASLAERCTCCRRERSARRKGAGWGRRVVAPSARASGKLRVSCLSFFGSSPWCLFVATVFQCLSQQCHKAS